MKRVRPDNLVVIVRVVLGCVRVTYVRSNVNIGPPFYERNWRSVNHKMALRPNILADAAFDVAFEVSMLLQDTDINLFGFDLERSLL